MIEMRIGSITYSDQTQQFNSLEHQNQRYFTNEISIAYQSPPASHTNPDVDTASTEQLHIANEYGSDSYTHSDHPEYLSFVDTANQTISAHPNEPVEIPNQQQWPFLATRAWAAPYSTTVTQSMVTPQAPGHQFREAQVKCSPSSSKPTTMSQSSAATAELPSNHQPIAIPQLSMCQSGEGLINMSSSNTIQPTATPQPSENQQIVVTLLQPQPPCQRRESVIRTSPSDSTQSTASLQASTNQRDIATPQSHSSRPHREGLISISSDSSIQLKALLHSSRSQLGKTAPQPRSTRQRRGSLVNMFSSKSPTTTSQRSTNQQIIAPLPYMGISRAIPINLRSERILQSTIMPKTSMHQTGREPIKASSRSHSQYTEAPGPSTNYQPLGQGTTMPNHTEVSSYLAVSGGPAGPPIQSSSEYSDSDGSSDSSHNGVSNQYFCRTVGPGAIRRCPPISSRP